ncbi:hypothetical protein WG66_004304 [Moniliophthora roreri]|nr:hypothetical protein WG66_004304 [Moniliophthora roreri]
MRFISLGPASSWVVAPLDIKRPSPRALSPALPVSLSGIIAGTPAKRSLHLHDAQLHPRY